MGRWGWPPVMALVMLFLKWKSKPATWFVTLCVWRTEGSRGTGECVLLTKVWPHQGPQCLSPMGRAKLSQVRQGRMAKPSSNSCADVDSVCKNVYHSLLSLDVYDLCSPIETAPADTSQPTSLFSCVNTHAACLSAWNNLPPCSTVCSLLPIQPCIINTWSFWCAVAFLYLCVCYFFILS